MGYLNELAAQIHRISKSKGFWNGGKDFGMSLALIHSEVSEALEEYRNGSFVYENYFDENGKLQGVPSELADVIIRVLDLCAAHEIDIDDIVSRKIDYNKTREYLHGGKKV